MERKAKQSEAKQKIYQQEIFFFLFLSLGERESKHKGKKKIILILFIERNKAKELVFYLFSYVLEFIFVLVTHLKILFCWLFL